jgi:hypothetical protein
VLKNALSGVFGLASPVFAPECSRTGTAVKDPDQGECNATSGTPDSAGKFSQLSFSKNLGWKHPFSVASRLRREIRPEN